MKIGNNGNLVLGPFDESTPCLMIVLMNCQTKLRINHLTAVKLVAILEIVSYRVLKIKVNKEKIRFLLQFFFDKDENASQVAEIANHIYGDNTLTANYLQFWFGRFRSGTFDVKDAPRTGIGPSSNIEIDWYVSNRSIAQEPKIGHKTVLNHLRKVGFK
ncbi:histone-lysine N-methyltransferase SETMAR [Trichonephila clavipes]|nr:histone-lysine N-methyltransferase SETMAR [Trichonephila clavipes]